MTNEIPKLIEILNSGGIILYPTDTVWGIGCDATNQKAVSKIYEIKKRADNKSMLVLLDNENRLASYVADVPEMAWDLIELSEKPITIIYPKGKNLASTLVGDDGSIGIRIAKDMFCQELIRKFRKPIVSTSANISGQPSPAFFNEISDEIKSSVDYIVEYRQDDRMARNPSSIIKLGINNEIKVLRE